MSFLSNSHFSFVVYISIQDKGLYMKKAFLIVVVLVGLSACVGSNDTAYNTESYNNTAPAQYNNDASYGYETGW